MNTMRAKMKMSLRLAILCLMISLALPEEAHAYLDPGTGSQLLQLLLAGLFGAIFTLKIYWQKLLGFFRSKFGKNNSADHE